MSIPDREITVVRSLHDPRSSLTGGLLNPTTRTGHGQSSPVDPCTSVAINLVLGPNGEARRPAWSRASRQNSFNEIEAYGEEAPVVPPSVAWRPSAPLSFDPIANALPSTSDSKVWHCPPSQDRTRSPWSHKYLTHSGCNLSRKSPRPSWPHVFSPQHHKDPSRPMPMECRAPQATRANDSGDVSAPVPTSCRGVSSLAVPPVPSLPERPQPQTKTVASLTTATACASPQAMCCTALPSS